MDRRIEAVLRLMAALGAIAAPALAAQAVMTQSAHAQTANTQTPYAQASALPPPPYAVTGQPAAYGGQQGYDRYGGGSSHPWVRTAAAAPAYAGPRLNWSGKTDAAPPPRRPAYAPAGYRPAMAPPPAPSTPQAVAAPPPGWSYVPPIGGAPVEPAPAPPTSIYDPAPAQASAMASAQPPSQSQTTTRHYSVHRDYGVAPDPIPLPPQFFGPTADLTQPETPDPQRRTTGADGKSRNLPQPTDGQ